MQAIRTIEADTETTAAATIQTDSRTVVVYNGQLGPNAPLDSLLALLRTKKLTVDNNGVEFDGHGMCTFSGNFDLVSHAFRVRTTDPEVAAAFFGAMVANRRRPDYVADVQYRAAAARDHALRLRAAGDSAGAEAANEEWSVIRPSEGAEIKGPALTPELAKMLGVDAIERATRRRGARP